MAHLKSAMAKEKKSASASYSYSTNSHGGTRSPPPPTTSSIVDKYYDSDNPADYDDDDEDYCNRNPCKCACPSYVKTEEDQQQPDWEAEDYAINSGQLISPPSAQPLHRVLTSVRLSDSLMVWNTVPPSAPLSAPQPEYYPSGVPVVLSASPATAIATATASQPASSGASPAKRKSGYFQAVTQNPNLWIVDVDHQCPLLDTWACNITSDCAEATKHFRNFHGYP